MVCSAMQRPLQPSLLPGGERSLSVTFPSSTVPCPWQVLLWSFNFSAIALANLQGPSKGIVDLVGGSEVARGYE